MPVLWLFGCVRVEPVPKDVIKDVKEEARREKDQAVGRYLEHHATYEKNGSAVPTFSWRTPEVGQEALTRARNALETHCGELDEAESGERKLVSRWRKTGRRSWVRRLWLRCTIDLVPEAQESGSKVIATFQVADCPRLKLEDESLKSTRLTPQDVEAKCQRTAHIPRAMADDLEATANTMMGHMVATQRAAGRPDRL